MKFLIRLTLGVLASIAAQAGVPSQYQKHSLSFDIDSNLPVESGHVYYRCDGIEQTAREILVKLGAKNIRAACAGGLEVNSPFASLDLSYSSLAQVNDDPHAIQGSVRAVKLTGFDNCLLVQQIFKNVKKTFVISHLQNTRSCLRTEDGYAISLDVLRE